MKKYFITVEGIEGAGKSTILQFMQEHLQHAQIPFVFTREPGGTEIADAIRQILLRPYTEKMYPDAELLLMFAARAQHVAHVIQPALEAGKWVICDRFTDASYAYQGAGRGIAAERIASIEKWLQPNLQPDITLLLDISVDLGLKRIASRQHDRIEQEQAEFFEHVRNGYLQRAKQFPQRFKIVDSSVPFTEVTAQIKTILDSLL